MSFKWTLVLIGSLLILGYVQTVHAVVESGTCDECHSIESQPKLKDCMVCHNSHNNEFMPVSPGSVKVHRKHNAMGYLPREECKQCHKPPNMIQCSDCHTNHTEELIINKSCTECHGGLPTPLGHSVERSQLPVGNHSWMQSCRVCHKGQNLKFGDVMVVEISDSLPLCSICHSQQYKEMDSGRHGKSSETCVDCHNPHTTKPPAGVNISITGPKLNTSAVISIWKKLPLIGNPVFLMVLFFIVISVVYEQIFASSEKGKILMSDNIRMNADKVHSKALEIWLSGNDIETLDKLILEIKNQGVFILGMTMKTDPAKVVLFLDFSGTGITPEELLNSVSGVSEYVESANYSDKYEV